MNSDIDFLKAQKSAEFQKVKALWLLRIGSIVLLAVYCVLASAIFSYWVYLKAESQNISKQINDKKQRIEQLRKVELLQVMLKGRLISLHELFSKKRPDYFRLLTYLNKVSQPGFAIRSMSVSEGGEIKITGMAPEAQIASKFLENLALPDSGISFEKAILSSAARSIDGVYNINLLLML